MNYTIPEYRQNLCAGRAAGMPGLRSRFFREEQLRNIQVSYIREGQLRNIQGRYIREEQLQNIQV